MRRSDREITTLAELIKIMDKCDVCRLSLNDESGYPYIIPLNFGIKLLEDKVVLYFHSACEGRKLDIIRQDIRASFEMDCDHLLQSFADKGYCTMSYQSVIGHGKISFVEDLYEKKEALTILTDHYHNEHFEFNPAAIPRTTVFKLDVTAMTGKKKVPKEYELKIKRIYDAPSAQDGIRILVDRLWPRGIKKENAALSFWWKELAPSNDLRKWYGHVPEKYTAFTAKYQAELAASELAIECRHKIKDILQRNVVTLIYAAKDTAHNNAVVLQKWLLETLKQ